jgi:hypothetical protein
MVGLVELSRSTKRDDLDDGSGRSEARSDESRDSQADRPHSQDDMSLNRRMRALELVFWWTTLDLFSETLEFRLELKGRFMGLIRLGLRAVLLWDYYSADDGYGSTSVRQVKQGVDKSTQTIHKELVDGFYENKQETFIRYEQGEGSPESRHGSESATRSRRTEYRSSYAHPFPISPAIALKEESEDGSEAEEDDGSDVLARETMGEAISDSESLTSDQDSVGSSHRPSRWMGKDERSDGKAYASRSATAEGDEWKNGREEVISDSDSRLDHKDDGYGSGDHETDSDQDEVEQVLGDGESTGNPTTGTKDGQSKRRDSIRFDQQADHQRTGNDPVEDPSEGLVNWEADSESSEAERSSHTHKRRIDETERHRASTTVTSRRSGRGDEAVLNNRTRAQIDTKDGQSGDGNGTSMGRKVEELHDMSALEQERLDGFVAEVDMGGRDIMSRADDSNGAGEFSMDQAEKVKTDTTADREGGFEDSSKPQQDEKDPVRPIQILPLRLKPRGRGRVQPEALQEESLAVQKPSSDRKEQETLKAIQTFRSTVRRPVGSSNTGRKEEDLLPPTGRSGLIRSIASSTEPACLASEMKVVKLSLKEKEEAGGHRRNRTIDVRESTGIQLDALLAEPWANIQ